MSTALTVAQSMTQCSTTKTWKSSGRWHWAVAHRNMVLVVSTVSRPANMVYTLPAQATKAKPPGKWRWEGWRGIAKVIAELQPLQDNFTSFLCKDPILTSFFILWLRYHIDCKDWHVFSWDNTIFFYPSSFRNYRCFIDLYLLLILTKVNNE